MRSRHVDKEVLKRNEHLIKSGLGVVEREVSPREKQQYLFISFCMGEIPNLRGPTLSCNPPLIAFPMKLFGREINVEIGHRWEYFFNFLYY
jgi:hypothetical protein